MSAQSRRRVRLAKLKVEPRRLQDRQRVPYEVLERFWRESMKGISISPKDHFTVGKTPEIRSGGLKELGKAIEKAVVSLESNLEEGLGNLTEQLLKP